MILEIISFFTGRKIVILEDKDGDLYKTILRRKKHPFTGKKCAYVYWFTKTRLVQLNDDNSVDNGSYIKRWCYS